MIVYLLFDLTPYENDKSDFNIVPSVKVFRIPVYTIFCNKGILYSCIQNISRLLIYGKQCKGSIQPQKKSVGQWSIQSNILFSHWLEGIYLKDIKMSQKYTDCPSVMLYRSIKEGCNKEDHDVHR